MKRPKELSEQKRRIIEDKQTEAPGSGKLLHHNADGSYICAKCGAILFTGDTKYDSRSGWPSFFDAKDGSVEFVQDNSHGMERTEAVCSKCKGHLGHVFDDGPSDKTGKRYCINSASLNFMGKDGEEIEG